MMTIDKINAVAAREFGCGLLALSPIAALWLADKILEETGKNVYLQISRKRNRYGKGTAFPEFGTALFDTMKF